MGFDAGLSSSTTDARGAVVCHPYGVGHDHEGISLGLTIGPYRVLLDCGLENLAPLGDQPSPDLVICSHAHYDHGRGLEL